MYISNITKKNPLQWHWRPVGELLLLSVLWSGCCLFDTFPISILNFIIKKRIWGTKNTKPYLHMNSRKKTHTQTISKWTDTNIYKMYDFFSPIYMCRSYDSFHTKYLLWLFFLRLFSCDFFSVTFFPVTFFPTF